MFCPFIVLLTKTSRRFFLLVSVFLCWHFSYILLYPHHLFPLSLQNHHYVILQVFTICMICVTNKFIARLGWTWVPLRHSSGFQLSLPYIWQQYIRFWCLPFARLPLALIHFLPSLVLPSRAITRSRVQLGFLLSTATSNTYLSADSTPPSLFVSSSEHLRDKFDAYSCSCVALFLSSRSTTNYLIRIRSQIPLSHPL